ncbi:hypothetical protein [Oryzifoliimicrobium ureilyticus]|uniref:hypothetical protein n=1 Tax=Oryzifoliimicrobium ureilyticus TaxID=3113724 RepID=UPI0030760FC3
MSRCGRIVLTGTSLSHTCVFKTDDKGGYIRSDPRFLSGVVGKSNLRLVEEGWSASIKLTSFDRRGNAVFTWVRHG